MDKTGITSKQARAVVALLQNRDIKSAATSVGLNERTLRNWLTEPDFVNAVNAAI